MLQLDDEVLDRSIIIIAYTPGQGLQGRQVTMVRSRRRVSEDFDLYEDPYLPEPMEAPPDTPSCNRQLANILTDRSANKQTYSSREVQHLQNITGFLEFM